MYTSLEVIVECTSRAPYGALYRMTTSLTLKRKQCFLSFGQWCFFKFLSFGQWCFFKFLNIVCPNQIQKPHSFHKK